MNLEPELSPQTPRTPLVLPPLPRLPEAGSPARTWAARIDRDLAGRLLRAVYTGLGLGVLFWGFIDDHALKFCAGGALLLLGQICRRALRKPEAQATTDATPREGNQVRLLALLIYVLGAGLMLSGYVDHFWGQDVSRTQVLALICSGGGVMLAGIAYDHYCKRRIDRPPTSSEARISRQLMILVYLVGLSVVLSGCIDYPMTQAPYELAGGASLFITALCSDYYFARRERRG
jgi:hypothetical protein